MERTFILDEVVEQLTYPLLWPCAFGPLVMLALSSFKFVFLVLVTESTQTYTNHIIWTLPVFLILFLFLLHLICWPLVSSSLLFAAHPSLSDRLLLVPQVWLERHFIRQTCLTLLLNFTPPLLLPHPLPLSVFLLFLHRPHHNLHFINVFLFFLI